MGLLGTTIFRANFFITLSLTLVATFSVSALSAPIFGRYQGVLKHENTKREQLAKIDFVVSKTSANELELKAMLTLQMGDFKSGEYLSYHYDRVRYNLLTGALTFDDSEQPISIFVKGFSGGKLVADVTSIWAGRVGQLVLNQDKKVKPSAPLIEPIWGEYSGDCADVPAKLQIYTMRSTDDLAHLAQPFGSYFIKANMPIDCKDGQCLNFRFTRGAYNFFAKEEQLSLVGARITLRCDVNGDNLKCRTPDEPIIGHYDLSSCSFRRISKETSGPRQLSPVEQAGVFSSASPERAVSAEGFSGLQSGEYKGYVFHEYLGIYQAVSLNVDVFQAGAGLERGTRISSFARLFFGDFSSIEFIPYRFAEKVYPNLITGPQNLVFDRIDANMDAVIQITESKGGVLKGNWYSIIFGRVGPFELRKEGLPTLPEEAKKMERLSGVYRGTKAHSSLSPDSQWLIRLQVTPGTKPPTTTENPFFPNLLKGSMYLYPLTSSLPIADGSYDFYTGRFGFLKAKEEGPEHGWIGAQINRNELQLYHVAAPSISPVIKFRPEVFRLVKEFE